MALLWSMMVEIRRIAPRSSAGTAPSGWPIGDKATSMSRQNADRVARQSPAAEGREDWAEALLDAEEPVLRMIGGGRPVDEVLEALCRMVEGLCQGVACSIVPKGTDGREAPTPAGW